MVKLRAINENNYLHFVISEKSLILKDRSPMNHKKSPLQTERGIFVGQLKESKILSKAIIVWLAGS